MITILWIWWRGFSLSRVYQVPFGLCFMAQDQPSGGGQLSSGWRSEPPILPVASSVPLDAHSKLLRRSSHGPFVFWRVLWCHKCEAQDWQSVGRACADFFYIVEMQCNVQDLCWALRCISICRQLPQVMERGRRAAAILEEQLLIESQSRRLSSFWIVSKASTVAKITTDWSQ